VEHEACGALEEVDPLPGVALLTMDLQYSDSLPTKVEMGLDDPLLRKMLNVLHRRYIIFRDDSLRLGEKATSMHAIRSSATK
jgi:hypothetical protein